MSEMNYEKERTKERDLPIYGREALLVFGATIAGYVFQYAAQISYLAKFGLDAQFVGFEIKFLLQFGTLMLLIGLFALIFLSLPAKLFKNVFRLRTVFWLSLPFIGHAFAQWRSDGFTNFVALSLILGALFVLFELGEIAVRAIRGEQIEEVLFEREAINKKTANASAFAALSDGVAGKAVVLTLVFLIFPFVVGSLVGGMSAQSKRRFYTVEYRGENYLLVHSLNSFSVSVGFDMQANDQVLITDKVLLLSIGEMSGLKMTSIWLSGNGWNLHSEKTKPTFCDWIGQKERLAKIAIFCDR
ncbi:hypothetical protein [Celeribacter sp.]|uniref:hypothetical protein n=1 Tax=Celeribacter sp. TaxID=1890673 RepID=UPI003A90ECD0